MRSSLLALGLFSVAAIHPALAQQAELGAASGDEPPVMAMQETPDQGQMPRPGPQEPMRHGAEGFGFKRFGGQHMGPPPEFMLAARLSALETRIGIRAEQLDAWRDYTSALQATLAPPRPNHAPVGPGTPLPNTEEQGPDSNADRAPQDPFAFQEKLADDMTRRAISAGKLKEAIAALRSKLTLEQLEILASADRPHGPPSGPWGAPPDDAAGPGVLPDHGRHPPVLPRIGE